MNEICLKCKNSCKFCTLANCHYCMKGLCEKCSNKVKNDFREILKQTNCDFCFHSLDTICSRCAIIIEEKIKYYKTINYRQTDSAQNLCKEDPCRCDSRCKCYIQSIYASHKKNELENYIVYEIHDSGTRNICSSCYVLRFPGKPFPEQWINC